METHLFNWEVNMFAMNKKYIINYDLNKVKNYDELIKAIKTFPNWGKILLSCWVVQSTSSAIKIAEFLWQHMDGDDGLFVAEITSDFAWANVICEEKWLKAI